MAVTDDVKLRIYNGALRRLGDRNLATLTDAREPRRVLEEVWGPANEVVKWALEKGEWNFAIRSVQADYDPDTASEFGFERVFEKPDDLRRLASLCADEYFNRPLENSEYLDEAGFWFTDFDVLYVRYVSDGDAYGMNSAAWTEQFRELLEMKLALESCERLTNSKGLGDRIFREMEKALKAAKSHDAMQEGVKRFPPGRWARSRGGYGVWRRDR